MTMPGPNMPMPGPDFDPTGLRFDRGDLDQTTTRTAGDGWAITGRGITLGNDPLCGHLPGEAHDDECAYWRGVALGEYPAPDGTFMTPVASLPPFNLRELAATHTTAAEIDRRERGAA